jgi:hypothetical protein
MEFESCTPPCTQPDYCPYTPKDQPIIKTIPNAPLRRSTSRDSTARRNLSASFASIPTDPHSFLECQLVRDLSTPNIDTTSLTFADGLTYYIPDSWFASIDEQERNISPYIDLKVMDFMQFFAVTYPTAEFYDSLLTPDNIISVFWASYFFNTDLMIRAAKYVRAHVHEYEAQQLVNVINIALKLKHVEIMQELIYVVLGRLLNYLQESMSSKWFELLESQVKIVVFDMFTAEDKTIVPYSFAKLLRSDH